jgi:hypothetical protein
MRVMANVAMVMNLDKCIGCHTCSVTCKQVWTNRPGTEYVYFNNVETKPGVGYPRRYEDQQYWHGGWTLDGKGRLQLRAGGRLRKLLSIFYNPDLPGIDDYGDPWTYDYQTVIDAPLGTPNPSAHSISALTGKDMTVSWGSNFEDDLAGAPEHAVADPNLDGLAERVKMEFEQVFMFYLPRISGPAGRLPRPARPRGAGAGARGGHPARLDRRRAALAGVRAGRAAPRRAAAAPGIPHPADGLVHPAVVAGGRHRARRRLRPGPGLRRHRLAAHPA